MIVPDINLLLYAYDESSPFHEKSKRWWEQVVNGTELVGLPWAVALGFLRLTTNRKVFARPLVTEDALKIISTWFASMVVRPLHPADTHLITLSSALLDAMGTGKLVTDAHIAAITIEHRATLHSHDRDFQRFSGLRIHDPLV